MISSPIYATITDKRQSARACLRVGILFSISGNCLYFLRPQKYAIVAARLISGIGWGIEGTFFFINFNTGRVQFKFNGLTDS